ncbi:type II secretion system F family protein [Sedimentitalea sp. JM2-8]|uniref:Type II secretion system F family protein n=1 Tax=Sedimentitalea xiamensis TaxID=3050037 RepID=A0ABT7FBT5_9RHOB|nr:type II secretion system F family protein [Sedimentitalea xiamensis]MDK3072572.1 type II secretion system F family protein [Sedimentitalea xiamensis]
MDNLLSAEFLNYAMLAGMFVGILLLITGLGQLFQRGEGRKEARNRRLRMIRAGVSNEEILALLRPDTRRGFLGRLPLIGDLPKMLSQAGMTIAPRSFLMFSALGVVGIAGGASLLVPLWQALPIALSLGLLVPVLIVRLRRDKRRKELTAQLPDALELMARSLKVGHPLNAAIGAVADEMQDPIGTEFGLIFDQISFGDELPDAVQDFADRSGVEDAQYLAASIAIQHGTGGDLGRIVLVLAKVIRNRISLRNRIRAISSEGRLSGLLLSIIPLVIIGMMSFNAPGYYMDVSDDPAFIKMAALVVVLMVTNVVVLHRIVNFRV